MPSTVILRLASVIPPGLYPELSERFERYTHYTYLRSEVEVESLHGGEMTNAVNNTPKTCISNP